MGKMRILCHSCEGKGWILERELGSLEEVKIICPECEGRKYVLMDVWDGGEKAE